MKRVIAVLTLLFSSYQLFAYERCAPHNTIPATAHVTSTYPIHTTHDIDGAIHHIIQEFNHLGIAGRIIVINRKNLEILFDIIPQNFHTMPETINAYHTFVTPLRHNQIPPSYTYWLALTDLYNRSVYIAAYDPNGRFINLKAILFSCKSSN